MLNKSIKLITKNCTICGAEISWQHKHKPKQCPVCGEVYFDKPKIEIDLFKLQNAYLENYNKDILGDMYVVLVKYSKNLIKNMIHNSYHMDKDILNIKAHEAATKFIEYYLTNKNFKMDKSFGAYLKYSIKNVLYAVKKIDKKTTSLNSILDESNHSELETIIESLNIKTIYNNRDREDENEKTINESIDFTNDIYSLLEESIKRLKQHYKISHIIKVLIGVKLHFYKISSNKINDYYSINNNDVKENVEKIMMLIFQYLKSMERQ